MGKKVEGKGDLGKCIHCTRHYWLLVKITSVTFQHRAAFKQISFINVDEIFVKKIK